MPTVCQSRQSEVHTHQRTKNGKTLSSTMASELVACNPVLVRGSQMTCNYHLQTTPLLQVCNVFCSNLTVVLAACTARDMVSLLTGSEHRIPKSSWASSTRNRVIKTQHVLESLCDHEWHPAVPAQQMTSHAESAVQWLENVMLSICYWNIQASFLLYGRVNLDVIANVNMCAAFGRAGFVLVHAGCGC